VYTKAFGGRIVYTQGPSNPSTSLVPYIIERSEGKSACFAHLFACRKANENAVVSEVSFVEEKDCLTLRFKLSGKEKEFNFEI